MFCFGRPILGGPRELMPGTELAHCKALVLCSHQRAKAIPAGLMTGLAPKRQIGAFWGGAIGSWEGHPSPKEQGI